MLHVFMFPKNDRFTQKRVGYWVTVYDDNGKRLARTWRAAPSEAYADAMSKVRGHSVFPRSIPYSKLVDLYEGKLLQFDV